MQGGTVVFRYKPDKKAHKTSQLIKRIDIKVSRITSIKKRKSYFFNCDVLSLHVVIFSTCLVAFFIATQQQLPIDEIYNYLQSNFTLANILSFSDFPTSSSSFPLQLFCFLHILLKPNKDWNPKKHKKPKAEVASNMRILNTFHSTYGVVQFIK